MLKVDSMKYEPRWTALRLLLIDLARKTRIRTSLSRLRQSQWLARDELEAMQLNKLQHLARFVFSEVPFYQAHGRTTGMRAEDLAALDDLAHLPVTTKTRMKQAPTDFLPANLRGETVLDRRTGGSTGTPFEYKMGRQAVSSQWGALFRAWEWAGCRLGDPMVTIGGGSVAPLGRPSLAQRVYNGLRRNTPLAAATLDEQGLASIAASLHAVQPTLVYGYPSVLYQVARYLQATGSRVPGVVGVVTTSEMLFPGQRRVLEAAFATPVHDQYGCNEVNLVTCECSAHDGWHVAMETSVVEILDEQDNPVTDGEVGRIVGTGLDNRGMAFVRYDTGDLGAIERRPCSCGRALIRITNLQGRTRDLVRAADGRLIHGVAFNQIVLRYSWVDRYQVIQISAQQLVMNVAATAQVASEEVSDLEQEVVRLCGLPVKLTLNGPFEDTAGGKVRVIISRLEDAS